MIVKNGEWPWPFTNIKKSDSSNGQIQKLAIHFQINWSGLKMEQGYLIFTSLTLGVGARVVDDGVDG